MDNNKLKRILVAEDDRFLASAYKAKLTRAGFEVTLAQDGDEAISFLSDKAFDLILLDLIMPKKDGFSVLEFIKTNPRASKVPVIIASNLGQEEDIKKGMSLGAKDFIIKSDMSLDDLIKKIDSLIS